METVNKYLSSVNSMPNSKKLILILIIVVVIMLVFEIYSSKKLFTNIINHSRKIEKLMNANGSLEEYDDEDEEEEEEEEEETQAESKPSAKKIKLSADKLNVTLFYAHWCGHCKQFLKDSWGKLKKQYEDSDVQLNEVDCTEVKSRIQTPGGNDIEGFPTLVFDYIDSNGDLQEEEYKGGRTVTHVTAHIKKVMKKMS
jgi:thiol-disulfide isomerase/thioredoxin